MLDYFQNSSKIAVEIEILKWKIDYTPERLVFYKKTYILNYLKNCLLNKFLIPTGTHLQEK